MEEQSSFIKDLEREVINLKKREAAVTNNYSRVLADIVVLSDENKALKKEIEKLKQISSIKLLEKQTFYNDSMEAKLLDLQVKIDNLNAAHSSQIKMLETDLKEKEDKIIFLETEITEFDINTRNNEKTISSLVKQLEETQTQLNNIISSQTAPKPQHLIFKLENNSFSNLDKSKLSTPDVSIEIEVSRKPSLSSKNQQIFSSFRINQPKLFEQYSKDKSAISFKAKTDKSIKSQFNIPELYTSQPFKCYVYVCGFKNKIINVLYIEKDVIILSLYNSTESRHIIPIDKITTIKCSKSDPFLFEIDYIENKAFSNKTLVFEAPNSRQIKRVVELSHLFKAGIKMVSQLDIEKVSNFKNASLNCIPHSNKIGFLEQFVNTMRKDWQLSLCAKVKNSVIVYKAPRKFVYKDYVKFKRNPDVYYLDNFNVITDNTSIGLARSTLFVLKIRNENVDLIFSSLHLNDLERWISAFN